MTTAFISYSWDSSEHKQWVRELATRLRGEGVEVTLDQWHLVLGDQLPDFMETAVRDSDYVLAICTPRYKERSDNRAGGVGYEGDIMTAEVMNSRNRRKFIPLLRTGPWAKAAPTWLAGSAYADLSASPYDEPNYEVLVSTLLGTQPQVPPVGLKLRGSSATKPVSTEPAAFQKSSKAVASFEPLRILELIADEVGTPSNDGTRGSALYSVPFRLSARPSSLWISLFLEAWAHPSVYTSMHRSDIAAVSGDRIILDGTTLSEVEQYHKATLKLAVQTANDETAGAQARQLQAESLERERIEQHRRNVQDAATGLTFDD